MAKLRAAGHWMVANLTAVLATGGLILFIALRFNYGRFYHQLGVSPEEVGLSESEILIRSAAGFLIVVGLSGVVFLAALGMYFLFLFLLLPFVAIVMVTMERIVVALVATLRGSSSDEQVKRVGHTVAITLMFSAFGLFLLLAFIGGGWWPFPVFVCIYFLAIAVDRVTDSARRPWFNVPELRGPMSGLRHKLRLFALYAWSKARTLGPKVVRQWFALSNIIVCTILGAIFLEGIYLPSRAIERSEAVKSGMDIPESESIVGVPVLRYEVQPVRIVPTAGRPLTDGLGLNSRECLVFLGGSDGTLVFFDSNADQALRIPSSSVALVTPVVRPARCREEDE
jgi:hypothetical protein